MDCIGRPRGHRRWRDAAFGWLVGMICMGKGSCRGKGGGESAKVDVGEEVRLVCMQM
jgi:hypothetical protein